MGSGSHMVAAALTGGFCFGTGSLLSSTCSSVAEHHGSWLWWVWSFTLCEEVSCSPVYDFFQAMIHWVFLDQITHSYLYFWRKLLIFLTELLSEWTAQEILGKSLFQQRPLSTVDSQLFELSGSVLLDPFTCWISGVLKVVMSPCSISPLSCSGHKVLFRSGGSSILQKAQ